MSKYSEIPKKIAASDPQPYKQKIPRTIRQTFETSAVPAGMHAAAMSWINNNPDYAYSFSDNEERRLLIEQHFGNDVLNAYNRLKIGAFRADLWRYCALYINGGIYADLDTVSKCPLRDILSRDDEFITVFAGSVPAGIFNAFVCSIPKHPFLARSIELAVNNILNGGEFHPLAITGPLCMGTAINLVLNRDTNTDFVAGDHTINGISFRILEKVRSQQPSERRVIYKGRTVLMCKYEGYDSDLATTGQQHWSGNPAC
jgi:mannosyltransferase OCH1-like enzyme